VQDFCPLITQFPDGFHLKLFYLLSPVSHSPANFIVNMCFWIAAVSLHLSLNKIIIVSSSFYCTTKPNLHVQPVKVLLASFGQKVCPKTRKETIYHNQYIILGCRQIYTRQIIVIKPRTTSLTTWKVTMVMRKTHRRIRFIQQLFRSIYLCSLQIQMPNVILEHILTTYFPWFWQETGRGKIRNIMKRLTLLTIKLTASNRHIFHLSTLQFCTKLAISFMNKNRWICNPELGSTEQ